MALGAIHASVVVWGPCVPKNTHPTLLRSGVLRQGKCGWLQGSYRAPNRFSIRSNPRTLLFSKKKMHQRIVSARNGGGGEEEEPELDKALNMNSEIPSTSEKFIEKMSSKAYDMRRRLEQSVESNSYDVLEKNPYQEPGKPVYILAKEENKIYTMRTRRNRSEVENELSMLFSSRKTARNSNKPEFSKTLNSKKAAPSNPFQMHVEDVREGVLVFEDEEVASNYCSILENKGEKCLGVAQIGASDIFAMVQKSNALAVLFRRGITPPEPDRLQRTLKARKRSLED